MGGLPREDLYEIQDKYMIPGRKLELSPADQLIYLLDTTDDDIRFFTYFGNTWNPTQLHQLFTYTNALFKINADYGAMWYHRLRYVEAQIERRVSRDQLQQLLSTDLVGSKITVKVPYSDLSAVEQREVDKLLAARAFKGLQLRLIPYRTTSMVRFESRVPPKPRQQRKAQRPCC